jgi:multidrug efflux pump subunit AcrB
LSLVQCAILLASMSAVLLGAQAIPKFRDAAIPDITVPQPQAQVVSPAVYAQLGSQDQALQNINRQLGEIKADITTIKADVKPLQETDVRVRFILTILGWLIGILLTSGIGGWVVHQLQSRKKPPTFTAKPGI